MARWLLAAALAVVAGAGPALRSEAGPQPAEPISLATAGAAAAGPATLAQPAQAAAPKRRSWAQLRVRSRRGRQGAAAVVAAALGRAPATEAWSEGQPFDAVVGAYLAASFREKPTETPPPSASSLRLDTECPLLLSWPTALEIAAPDPCAESPTGNWTAAGAGGAKASLMNWVESCGSVAGGPMPEVAYALPNGGLFGTSKASLAVVGSSMELRDCAGYARYVVTERVVHAAGKPDDEVCRRYGSCDGVVLLQFLLKDPNGTVLAQTTSLRLFQDSFDLKDTSGATLASVSRVGSWTPNGGKCGEPRKWAVRLAYLDGPVQHWAVAALVTIMAGRDARRHSSGLVGPSVCEVSKSLGLALAVGLGSLVLLVCCAGCQRVGLPKVRKLLLRMEQAVCLRPRPFRQPKQWDC